MNPPLKGGIVRQSTQTNKNRSPPLKARLRAGARRLAGTEEETNREEVAKATKTLTLQGIVALQGAHPKNQDVRRGGSRDHRPGQGPTGVCIRKISSINLATCSPASTLIPAPKIFCVLQTDVKQEKKLRTLADVRVSCLARQLEPTLLTYSILSNWKGGVGSQK